MTNTATPYTLVDKHGKIIQIGSSYVLPPVGDGDLIMEAAPSLNHYRFNGRWVKVPDQPSVNHEFNWITKLWQDTRTLEQLKAEKWVEIKTARTLAEYGGFLWNGSVFDSDPVSQEKIRGAARMAEKLLGHTEEWTLADNTLRLLNAEDLQSVELCMTLHVATQHHKARGIRQQIEAATSTAQLNALGW